MGDSFVIVKQHPRLIEYVDSLQRANAECLSFYPKQVFEREAARGRIFLSLLNGEPCGYLYIGSGQDGTMRCHQVCIQYDARRRLYGAQLVVCMEAEAVRVGATWTQLRCGFDLDANEFWLSLGYSCIRHDVGGVRRMRTINVWAKAISPALFDVEHIEPAKGKASASLWAKHKQVGTVTQFVRGAAMRDYRAAIEKADDDTK
jgi:hypothetical protein